MATTDRRVRERDAADEAQAALVIAQPFRVQAEDAIKPGLGVVVQNYGSLSILGVTVVRLQVEGHPHLDLQRPEGGSTTIRCLFARGRG